MDTKFFKDGVSYPVFFKFDKGSGEWQYAAYSPNKWYKISGIEAATVDGKTRMSSFGFVESVQETVNAALAAQKRSRELGLPLKDPNAPSPIVQVIPK